MKTIAESRDTEDAASGVRLAKQFVEARREIPSSVIDLVRRAARSKEGRKALRAQNPPRELIAALERGGMKL